MIHPILRDGAWMFSDPAVGLVEEPFVAGIPEMIDVLVESFAAPNSGFNLFFADSPFPGHTLKLTHVQNQAGGARYETILPNGMQSSGWLCPALLRYFEAPPEAIYVRAEEARR